MRQRKSLLRALLAATKSMIDGGLSESSRRCGKPTCQCAHDPTYRHGPHLYLTYQDQGKRRSLYVPPEHAAATQAAHGAWTTFSAIGSAIASLNREQLRRQWQHDAPPRPTQTRRRRRGD